MDHDILSGERGLYGVNPQGCGLAPLLFTINILYINDLRLFNLFSITRMYADVTILT